MSKQVSSENEAGTAETQEAEAQAEVRTAQLEEELEGKERRIEELLNRLAYLQADLENLRKRMEKERAELARFASEDLLQRLIPAVEEFEMALASLPDREDDWGEGLRMVYENLRKVLREEGLEVIDPQGDRFDPYLHEAVETVRGEEAGRIAEVRKKGYRLAHRVLRPAHVVVTKKEGDEHG